MKDLIRIEDVLAKDVLPLLPAVAVKILSLDPETSASQMAGVISGDPSLASRILKAANSPLNAPLSPVGSIKRAIALLGDRQVRSLTLAFSLFPLQCPFLDFSLFWKHSLATAVGSRQILSGQGSRFAEDGFIVGLLADIGTILMAASHPERYQKVILSNSHKGAALKAREREVFGFDHSELGAAAARCWRFPQSFQDVIAHHHDPDKYQGDENILYLLYATHLASIAAEMLHTDHPEILKNVFQLAQQNYPSFTNLIFEDLVRNMAEETQTFATWMGIHLTVTDPIDQILEQANKKLVEVCLEYEEAMRWLYRTQGNLIRPGNDSTFEYRSGE